MSKIANLLRNTDGPSRERLAAAEVVEKAKAEVVEAEATLAAARHAADDNSLGDRRIVPMMPRPDATPPGPNDDKRRIEYDKQRRLYETAVEAETSAMGRRDAANRALAAAEGAERAAWTERDHRIELAQALEAAARSVAALEAGKAAVKRANGMVAKAEEALATAVASVANAREQNVKQAEDFALNGDAATSSPRASTELREARAYEAEVRDQIDAAGAALATVEAALPALERDAAQAASRFNDAVDAVLLTGAERLIADAQRLQDELSEKTGVLMYLSERARTRRFEGQRATIEDFLAKGPFVLQADAYHQHIQHPASEPWRAVREALRRNAEAPLPD